MKMSKNPVECPKCGKPGNYVWNTYYTERSEVVRQRRCVECGNRFVTIQEPEVPLIEEDWRVVYAAKKSADYKRKVVQLERRQHGTTHR
jgi:transcriptional regulator NrdR family protein